MKFMMAIAVGSSLLGVASCTTKDATHVSDEINALIGKPLGQAIEAFGPANRTVIEDGKSVSYWLKVEIEHYAGLSNRREVRVIDGKRSETRSEGMKMKEHRSDCVIKIGSNEQSVITSTELMGNPMGCTSALGSMNLALSR